MAALLKTFNVPDRMGEIFRGKRISPMVGRGDSILSDHERCPRSNALTAAHAGTSKVGQ
ncbi:MAG: hypothetical protein MUC98_07305 [Desulfobacterota bacterium]|jgi:hypothetical protein|nr:hypothetical protein [Thermodesulfobacteriota bacterium]